MKKFLVLVCLIICSCSFKPLNTAFKGREYSEMLAQVKFGKLNSEYSYLLNDYLDDQFNPQNLALDKAFILDTTITSNIEGLLVQKDTVIDRQEVKFDVSFSIKDIESGDIISKGNFPISVSYGETASLYSTYINKEYSYKNGLKEVARQLKLRTLIAITKNQLNEDSAKRN